MSRDGKNISRLIEDLHFDLKSVDNMKGGVAEDTTREERVSSIAVDDAHATVVDCGPRKCSKYTLFFLKHMCLSTEIFAFFFIFLAVMRPSFLYYNEKVISNRRELIRTRFSILYLFIYSAFFTVIIHLLIYTRNKLCDHYHSHA